LAQRADARANKLPVPPFPAAQGFAAGAVPVWRIRAQAVMPDGVTFVRDAVLRPSMDPRRPVIALLWQEGPAVASPDPAAGDSPGRRCRRGRARRARGNRGAANARLWSRNVERQSNCRFAALADSAQADRIAGRRRRKSAAGADLRSRPPHALSPRPTLLRCG